MFVKKLLNPPTKKKVGSHFLGIIFNSQGGDKTCVSLGPQLVHHLGARHDQRGGRRWKWSRRVSGVLRHDGQEDAGVRHGE